MTRCEEQGRPSDTNNKPSHKNEASDTGSESQMTEGCDADCCRYTPDKPNQHLKMLLPSTKQKQGFQTTYVQASWFMLHIKH